MSTAGYWPGEHSHASRDLLMALASGTAAPQRTVLPAGVSRRLDDRSRAIACLGALLGTGGSSSAYERLVADALEAGISVEEIVEVLIEVARTVGLARLVPAAVELALALGYDVDRALEHRDDDR